MICNLCLLDKNDDEFEKNRRKCKKCRYERFKEIQKTEKYKEYKRKYEKTERRIKHVKEYQKEYTKCHSCKLFVTSSRTNYFCSYCSPISSKRQKTKELQLKTFLKKYYQLIYNKKVNLDNSCQTYFPDFLIDCNTFFICIECDENAHRSYDKNCELIRMNNITYSLGLPVVFLRFNPDKKQIKMKTKQTILKSYIDYYTDKKLTDNVIEYLFY